MPLKGTGIFMVGSGGVVRSGGPSSTYVPERLAAAMTKEQLDQLAALENRVSELRGYL